MKNAFYLLAIALCCACNSEKKEAAQAVIPTPTGLQGLQKSNVTAAPTAGANNSLIFNPPHGEAGHTCALAVGARLNKTVSPQPQQTTTPQPTPAPVSAPAPETAVVSTGKLNPKHGEAGHRCDIAVGVPLNSKPEAVAKTVVAQPTVTQVSNVKVGKGLNPPHGQPNHRCDLAVGAPLNGKPAQPVVTTPLVETETKGTAVKNEGD